MTDAGRDVRAHFSTQSSPRPKGDLPDAVVISLDRLPSHGRAVAEWFWEAKSRRGIPIVFEGGKPDKVAAASEKFPEARFCETGQVEDMLRTPSGDRTGVAWCKRTLSSRRNGSSYETGGRTTGYSCDRCLSTPT